MRSVMKILKGVGSLLRGIAWDSLVGLPGNILGDMISDVVQSAAEKLRDARAVKNAAGAVTERMTTTEALAEARNLLERIAAECGAPEGEARLSAFGEDLMDAMQNERITSAGMYEFLAQSSTYNNLSGGEQRIVEDALDELREALLTVHFKALNGESKALYKCIEALIDPKAFAEALVRELRGGGDGVMPPVGEISRKYAFAYIKHECPECHAAGERVRYDATSGRLVCGACGGKYTLTQNLESALSKEHFHATLAELEIGLGKRITTAVEDITAHAEENMQTILEAIRERGGTVGVQVVQAPTAVATSAVPHGDAPAELSYVYFGEYPQSIKSEEVRILTETDDRGYHKGSDGAYYAKLERSERIEVKRHRWSKGAKREATRLVPRYYKVEPIRWRMLSRQGERVLLLCDTVLDTIPFGDSSTGGYDQCGLRSWLNCTFYDAAFSAEEKRHVLTTCVENGVKKGRVACGNECSDTNDKIFALSEKEATDPAYGFLSEGDHDERRRIAASTYAKERGADGWWLRSSTSSEFVGKYHYQLFVGVDGRVAATMVDWRSGGAVCGVVPALCAVFTADELAKRCEPPTAFASSEIVAPKTEAQTEKPAASPICRIKRNHVCFGEYPQSLKSPRVRITAEKDERGYYKGSDGAWYAEVIASPHKDSRFGNGEKPAEGGIYYFKVEPIRWRVLRRSGASALLLCESILAARVFNKYGNNYAESNIRKWLNGGFIINAFTSEQSEAILPTHVDNSAASTGMAGNPFACKNTEDKIFLLSVSEARNTDYGFGASKDDDKMRRRQPSDYAVATGAATFPNGCGLWWLRSPHYFAAGENATYVHSVNCDGSIYDDYIRDDDCGVVPALWIRL